ncbi:MAG: efflux RND transporter periplasmic adaptor subunit [Sphaerochaeta sp.]|jgi:RND family efflux transporter MFP subunit|nr:efflux RND transporter periplasmic adaptor subunit [Spirochaetales bacterium]
MKKDSGDILSLIARYAVLAAVIVVVLLAVDVFLSNRDTIVYSPPKPLVVVEKPQTGRVSRRGVFPSYVQARDIVPVVALVGGKIESFPVTVGQLLQKGEVLATIDSEPFMQQVKQAEAAYLASESTFARISSLYHNKATTEQNYDQAKAHRDAAKAQYELANLQVGHATVEAPVTGTILMKNSSVGSIAGGQQSLAVMADLSSLVVKVEVPETYYEKFWNNLDALRIEVTSPRWEHPVAAKLLHIDPFVQSESKTFKLEVLLESVEELVRPGMAVSVSITYEEEDDAYRMSQSIRKSDGSWYIYHPDTGQVEYVRVPVALENEEFFKIPEAYQESYFVVDGQHILFDGQEVRVAGESL